MPPSLHHSFFHALDPAVCEQVAQELAAGRGAWPAVGEGRHFRAWRLAGSLGLGDAVLRLAKEPFFRFQGKGLAAWLSAVNRLGRLGEPLIPPMRAWQSADGHCLLLMPYFPEAIPARAWKDDAGLRAAWAETQGRLASLGLRLGDDPQGRRGRDGAPYLVDWSELGLTAR